MATPSPRPATRLFPRGSWPEVSRIGDILRAETVGGAPARRGRSLALVWANSPLARRLRRGVATSGSGPAALHLDLTLAQWAADGLLAIFFFVAGLELKREFVAGDLRNPRRAALPVAAAVGGMVLPGAGLRRGQHPRRRGTLAGWAIPTATDIAFALAVLAVVGTAPADRAAHVPADPRRRRRPARDHDHRASSTPRTCTCSRCCWPRCRWRCSPCSSSAASAPGGCCCRSPLATWALVHASGVHATVAGVLLGFTVPVRRGAPRARDPAWPSTSNTASARCPPASPCPCSRSSPPGSRSPAPADSAPACADPITAGSSPGSSSARPSACSAPRGWSQRFTRAQLARRN